jgi:hypothetical protein
MRRQPDSTLSPRRRAPGVRASGAGSARARHRRGVAAVLAMMFLVLFGSLAAAMAVVAQGNLRTADSSLKVSRAMSAAETGLVFAASRMQEESSRFIVEKGVIDFDFADAIWRGELSSGDYDLLPPSYPAPPSDPRGIMEAIRDAHLADDHAADLELGDEDLPKLDPVGGVLVVKPIPISPDEGAPYFRLRYEMLLDVPMVRLTSVGVDGNIRRTLQIDFEIIKKIEYAILSPNRIMIGKNVLVEGPLGCVYGVGPEADTELHTENGDPLVMRSDYYWLDEDLDTKLDTLYDQIVLDDVDGDARLRPNHPIEGAALAGLPDLVDTDGDEYIDDFDLFLAHYDLNGDGMIVYNSARAAEVGLTGLTDEFTDVDDEVIDLQLARLVDLAMPDRDNDGEEETGSDIGLGYHNGVIDIHDQYAKVAGRLRFSVAQAAWEAAPAHGESYQTVVQGPIRAGLDEAPVSFEVPEDELLEITTEMFDDSSSWFETQVAGHSGAGLGGGPTADPAALVNEAIFGGGDPANFTASAAADWESVPYEAAGAYDHYQRPVYRNMTFRNLRIPMGNNGLFENCTFLGVTWIESERDCNHVDWNYAGALEQVVQGETTIYELRFPDLPPQADIDAGDVVQDTRQISNNIRFESCTFLGSISGDKLATYTHWRNKVQITGATRFYVDPDDVDPPDQTDASGTLLTDYLGAMSDTDRIELSKSSILLPGWSVDVGNFNNEVAADPDETPSVRLKGVIIAGVLDVRGTAEVHGTLLMTFPPVQGEGPLFYGGKPDAFNTTIGYFGPDDGDDEGTDPTSPDFDGFGEIRIRYDPDALLPDGIPWPIRMDADAETYTEGGSS